MKIHLQLLTNRGVSCAWMDPW